jgi:predicted peptidase
MTLGRLLLPLVFAISCAPGFVPGPDSGFFARQVLVDGAAYRYQVHLPRGWSKERRWPVLVYLHGGGEIGRDNVRQTQEGLGPTLHRLYRRGERFPFVVVLPQCTPGRYWPSPDMEAMVLAGLKQTIAEFSGDPERVILTGNSMGGYGTILLGAKHPGTFAALIPICGGVRPPSWFPRSLLPPEALWIGEPDPYLAVARRIGRTPVWVFHGREDSMLPAAESRRVVAALRAAGGDVRYTEYPGVGHNAWDRAYGEAALWSWALSRRRAP